MVAMVSRTFATANINTILDRITDQTSPVHQDSLTRLNVFLPLHMTEIGELLGRTSAQCITKMDYHVIAIDVFIAVRVNNTARKALVMRSTAVDIKKKNMQQQNITPENFKAEDFGKIIIFR